MTVCCLASYPSPHHRTQRDPVVCNQRDQKSHSTMVICGASVSHVTFRGCRTEVKMCLSPSGDKIITALRKWLSEGFNVCTTVTVP